MNVSQQVKFLIKVYERINSDLEFEKKIITLVNDNQISQEAVQIIVLMFDIKSMYDVLDDNLISNKKLKYRTELKLARGVADELAKPKVKPVIQPDPCSSGMRSTSFRGGC